MTVVVVVVVVVVAAANFVRLEDFCIIPFCSVEAELKFCFVEVELKIESGVSVSALYMGWVSTWRAAVHRSHTGLKHTWST